MLKSDHQKLASDLNSRLDMLKNDLQTLIQGMAEQKQEILHTLNTTVAELCNRDTTLSESNVNMQTKPLLNNSESFSLCPTLAILQKLLDR